MHDVLMYYITLECHLQRRRSAILSLVFVNVHGAAKLAMRYHLSRVGAFRAPARSPHLVRSTTVPSHVQGQSSSRVPL